MSGIQTKEQIEEQLIATGQAGADAMAAAREPLSDQETSEYQKGTLAADGENEGGAYLVRGAKLCCSCGSHIRKANLMQCHGVYVGENPILHEMDCSVGEAQNITWFGICTADGADELPGDNVCFELTEENNVNGQVGEAGPGKKCQPDITASWQNVYTATKIVDTLTDDPEILQNCNAITTRSYLVCNLGGLIQPLTSGQEYVMTIDDLGENLKDGEDIKDDLWEEIERARESGASACGEEDCFLAHERHPKDDPYLDFKGDIHGEGYYRVVYQYQNGEIIDIQHVKEGERSIPPDVEKEGYIFLKWDEQKSNFVNNDLTITAICKIDASDKEFAKQYIWDFFINEGFSVYAVAGIMGNIEVETGGRFDSATIEIGGSRYGLFQVGGNRKENLIAWARRRAEEMGWPENEWDNAWADLQFQCEYALDEYYYPHNYGWQSTYFDVTVDGERIKMRGTEEAFEGTESAVVAALIWAASFERCFKEGMYYYENSHKCYTEYQGQSERCAAAKDYLSIYGRIEQ